MTAPVSNNRPVAAPKPVAAPAANAPASNAPAKPAAPAGDSLALSATAKATAPKKTVEIDGKQYELRETNKKWNTWDKIATWTGTGIGGVAGVFIGAFCAIGVNFSGAITPASAAAWLIGWAVTTGVGYLAGRGVAKTGNAVGGLFDGK